MARVTPKAAPNDSSLTKVAASSLPLRKVNSQAFTLHLESTPTSDGVAATRVNSNPRRFAVIATNVNGRPRLKARHLPAYHFTSVRGTHQSSGSCLSPFISYAP